MKHKEYPAQKFRERRFWTQIVYFLAVALLFGNELGPVVIGVHPIQFE